MNVKSIAIKFNKLDDQAMVDDRSGEIVRILRNIADSIESYGVPNQNGSYLKDSNGNTVGIIEMDIDYDADQG